MRLYLLRHGIAEDARPGQTDAARELTPEGVEAVEAEARTLARLGLTLDAIFTSPLPRAHHTAQIVAAALGAQGLLRVDPRLAPGASLADAAAIAAENPGLGAAMLVGHNPDLPEMAADLVGGGAVDLKKGGLIRVDTIAVQPGAGVLVWLLPPAVLKR